jgi:hypothetical protein
VSGTDASGEKEAEDNECALHGGDLDRDWDVDVWPRRLGAGIIAFTGMRYSRFRSYERSYISAINICPCNGVLLRFALFYF